MPSSSSTTGAGPTAIRWSRPPKRGSWNSWSTPTWSQNRSSARFPSETALSPPRSWPSTPSWPAARPSTCRYWWRPWRPSATRISSSTTSPPSAAPGRSSSSTAPWGRSLDSTAACICSAPPATAPAARWPGPSAFCCGTAPRPAPTAFSGANGGTPAGATTASRKTRNPPGTRCTCSWASTAIPVP